MPGSYDPADSGLAKYFLAMLDDADRNNQYSRAIKACIDEFKANNKGKAPTVLDIGVGTGMLSGLCLLHGAKHVTGVDVNSTMVQLAKTSLEQVQQHMYPDAARKSYTVKLVKKGASVMIEKGAGEGASAGGYMHSAKANVDFHVAFPSRSASGIFQ